MNKFVAITICFLISCSSKIQKPVGEWKAEEESMTFIFTENTVKIIDVLKMNYGKVENIRTFNYSLEKDKLKLQFLSFKARPISEKLPDNVVLHDFYAYEKYDGPKVINCMLVKKDSQTLLFELDGKKKLTLKKLE